MQREKISFNIKSEKINEKEYFSDSNNSIEETSYSSNQEKNSFFQLKLDFQIPDFLNDKSKIIIKNKKNYTLIPDWYINLNNFNFTNFEEESLFS